MFSHKEFIHAAFITIIAVIISLFLLLPSALLLPASIEQFVPEWLQNQSLLTYFTSHLDFFISLIIPIGIVMIIIYLWRYA